MEFKTQKSTRIYLHPYNSHRLVMFMRDFKIVNAELNTKSNSNQKGASLCLLGSDFEEMDWKNSEFDTRTPHPIFTLKTRDVSGADVAMKAFDSCDEVNPVTFIRYEITNNNSYTVTGVLRAYPCTGPDSYLTGMWDTGYQTFAPNIRQQYMLNSYYHETEKGTMTDGYAVVKVLKSDTMICFCGKQDHFFKASNYFEIPFSISAGENKTVDLAFCLGDRIDKDYDFDLEEVKTTAYWDNIYSKVKIRPSNVSSKLMDVYYSQITTCLQMIQTYDDGTVFPRQGCVGRFMWEWEAMAYLVPLSRIGLGEYVKPAVITMMTKYMIQDKDSRDYGRLANPSVVWANNGGSALYCVSEYLIYTHDNATYHLLKPYIEMLVSWIERKRSETVGTDELNGLFPSMKASDWALVGQHYTYTDSVNVMAYRSLVKMAELFCDDKLEYYKSIYEDYYSVLQNAIESLVVNHDESEDYMPTHILGKTFEDVRIHCYTTDGCVYLPMCGNLDVNSKFFGFVERFYEKHGLFDNGLSARMTNLDWGEYSVYGDVYYTNVAEICWMYIYLQKGDREKAEKMLEALYRSNLTDEYITSERYTPLTQWYAPWQPNASASGRIITAMVEFYGEDSV